LAELVRRQQDRRVVGPTPARAPRTIGDAHAVAVIIATLEQTSPRCPHSSTQSMAAATGMSPSAVSRNWRRSGLRPHQVAPFKLSPGSEFIDKVFDSQGLHTIGGSAGSVAV
jgi:hypothetical protein